ncbi:MAG: F0F1 ATP synthase subunit A [Acidobacteria bacterium]|nr:F0F1 ATP synthase subunit A [Acidobacteriota bacterium]
MKTLYAAKVIEVGVHPTVHLLGMTFDTDIIMSTILAFAIFMFLVFRMTSKVTDGVPSKIQIFWEMIVGMVSDLAESAMGDRGKRFVPLGVTLFLFILICNWIGFLPTSMHPGQSGEIFPAPTGDVNLPLAMALLVIVWVHVESVRARHLSGYLKHYAQPYTALTPINVIEEITKPITLTFRLFGNMFSGGLMIAVMTTLLPIYAVPFGEIIWKPFDALIGVIQAYIFMLLAVLYFGMATSHDESPDEHRAESLDALQASH